MAGINASFDFLLNEDHTIICVVNITNKNIMMKYESWLKLPTIIANKIDDINNMKDICL